MIDYGRFCMFTLERLLTDGCIVRGRNRIAFLLKSPLYLFCVSDWGEPEHVVSSHSSHRHS